MEDNPQKSGIRYPFSSFYLLSTTTYDFIDNVTILQKTTFNQIGLTLTEVEKATMIY